MKDIEIIQHDPWTTHIFLGRAHVIVRHTDSEAIKSITLSDRSQVIHADNEGLDDWIRVLEEARKLCR